MKPSNARNFSRLLGGLLITLAVFHGAGCAQITEVQPNPAPQGADITITGTGFGATQGAGSVLYDGAAMPVVSWVDTSIVATLPSPKADGTYTLSVVVGGANSASAQHTISTPVPGISDVQPNPTNAGAQITITGVNFGPTQGTSQIEYDGAPLAVTSWSDTSIVATLPDPKADGTYSVSVVVNSISGTYQHTIQNPPPGMVFVPAGEFIMGSIAQPDEKPVHTVYLDAYWIDRTEVTVDEYAACVSGGGCTAPNLSHADDDSCNWGAPGRGDHPINCADWFKSRAYCSWVGKRFPTEAEWEKAARGTDTRTYPWGEATPTCNYAVMWDLNAGGVGCGLGTTWPVGSKVAGVSPYGALDMAGNVSEWVNDWYSSTYYSVSPYANPPGPPNGVTKLFRGGSFIAGASSARTSDRFEAGAPSTAFSDTGFRCARND